MTWIGWWTLSEAERLSIGHRFKNVTELALWMVYFQTDEEFQVLVASFPALEVLSLQTIRFQVTDLEETHSHVEHTLPANLHTISLNDIYNPRVIRSLIPCPSLRVFKCHFVNFDDFTPTLAKEFGWLLLSAGERSEDFGFTIQAGGLFNDGVDVGMFSTYFSSFSLISSRRCLLWSYVRVWVRFKADGPNVESQGYDYEAEVWYRMRRSSVASAGAGS